MSVKNLKTIERTIHLLGAAILLVFVYTSRLDDAAWISLVRFVVIPMLSLSGLVLWQAPRVVRLTRREAVAR